VLNASGGTILARSDSNNSAFFQGIWVNLNSGGLTFDTADNFVTIATPLRGTGSLTKRGDGMLILSGFSTYAGDTVVEQGTLVMEMEYLDDQSALVIAPGATVDLAHGIQDQVGSLTLGGQTFNSGTFGSSMSNAET